MTLLVINQNLSAQNDDAIFLYGEFKDNSTVYLYADNVNVRESPSTSSKVITKLPIASKVIINGKSEKLLTVNGYKTCWYEIGFVKNGKKQNGYVWGGFLSAVTMSAKNAAGEEVTFLYAITGFTEDKGFDSGMKAVVNGKIFSSLTFKPMYTDMTSGIYNYNIDGKIKGNKGLKNISKIIVLSFIYPACGYTNGDIHIYWTGNQLIYGIESPMVSEAGIFYFSTELIYPDDEGGEDGKLIKKVINESYDETGNTAEKSVKKLLYKWDGSKLVDLNE